MKIYDIKATTIEGKEISLDAYKGKVLLIVNTASKCGFTPQYEGLQKLYEDLNNKGFEILGFPSNQFAEQEPGSNNEVENFCKINFGVTFPLFEKIDVRGENAHPLFKFLSSQKPFKGFDMKHPIGEPLMKLLQESFPEYLSDDSIKWNFTKFLIDKEGNVVERFEPTTEPSEIKANIEALL